MKFKELDTVRVLKDLSNEIKQGSIGVVLMRFNSPQEAYEVEFVDGKGMTIAEYAVDAVYLEKINLTWKDIFDDPFPIFYNNRLHEKCFFETFEGNAREWIYKKGERVISLLVQIHIFSI